MTAEEQEMKAGKVLLSMKWLGKPVPKARPRASGHFYTPPRTAKFERKLKKAVQRRWGKRVAPTGAAVEVAIKIDRGIPKSWTIKRITEVMINGDKPIGPGDVDNIGKSILDAINGVVYEDDKQIHKLTIKREYAEEDAFHIVIREVTRGRGNNALLERILARRKARKVAT